MGENGLCRENDEPWKILEFYSGIGGMRYSVIKAGIRARILEAFDINDRANDVYQHNFGHRPHQNMVDGSQVEDRNTEERGCNENFHSRKEKWKRLMSNIQSLTAAELDKYGADAWLLSPPCQPYTRQGLQKDSDDARASSFLKILELIPLTFQPPLMLFVENVVGFETSNTHKQMMEIFAKSGFVTQEYILTPLQFGVPYSRPRYFCLAKRKPSTFQNPLLNSQLLGTPITLLAHENAAMIDGCNDLHLPCDPIKDFLEMKISFGNHSGKTSEENISDSQSLDQYTVPLSLIERWGSAMDIVYPNSKRCCCFTKSYYRYVKGTGSLLATIQNDESLSEKDEIQTLKELGLRYFTPREVANLHSFPKDFHFPQHITLKQKYALLGNSLSVAVVAPLLRYLFTEPL